MGTSDATPVRGLQDIDWEGNWDRETGLWWQNGPGHCASVAELDRVHSGPNATLNLLLAAELGQLERIDVRRVLEALQAMQIRDGGPNHGRFYWYAEETQLADDHAVFFNGQALIALWAMHREELDDNSRRLVREIFRDMTVYATARSRGRDLHYPNHHLGYQICAWLPQEFLGIEDADGELAALLEETADYLLEHHWGWGEHLSDGYGAICLDEISLLLLLSKRLPDETRAKYRELLAELLAIEDAFDGGPRVPAIRSYAFDRVPQHTNYRDAIRPIPEDALLPDSVVGRLMTVSAPLPTASGHTWYALANVLCSLGWHGLAPPRQPARRDITVPCVDGITASARVDDDVRVGSLNRFPIMPTAEHPTWGLSWQCFPVALWRAEGDWAFFQWEAVEQGRRRCHPAEDKHNAYLGNALTTSVRPPIVGRMYALQHEGNVIVLRIMPAITDEWSQLCDRFRIISEHLDWQASECGANDRPWAQLLLSYPQRQIAVACLSLPPSLLPEVVNRTDRITDWQLTCDAESLRTRRSLVTLWGLCLEGEITEPPELLPDPAAPAVPRSAEEKAWQLKWEWPTTEWQLRIDPLDANPLQEG